jgi:hypothetical protein
MKYLMVLLALSVVAIVTAAGALLWRLRWHLRRPHVTPAAPAPEVVSEEQPVEKIQSVHP